MPELTGASHWINSPPLTRQALEGKVVVIDFWTYSCINCLRALPYLRNWFAKYADSGLVIIGIHSPEFAFERDEANVEQAVRDLKLAYPVANDSAHTIWRAFGNRYWPAHYFIDIRGHIRYRHFGEGNYDQSERVIQRLLAERNGRMHNSEAAFDAPGVEAPPSSGDVQSSETYVGYDRQDGLASPQEVRRNIPLEYSVPPTLDLNDWALAGQWNVGAEQATLVRASGSIAFRFHARDLHLVMGASANGKVVPFRAKLDGQPVGIAHGEDVDESGNGMVSGHRLYQLIRQRGPVRDRTFQIEFLQPGVQVFAFTFG